jgi:hypothetical protein
MISDVILVKYTILGLHARFSPWPVVFSKAKLHFWTWIRFISP